MGEIHCSAIQAEGATADDQRRAWDRPITKINRFWLASGDAWTTRLLAGLRQLLRLVLLTTPGPGSYQEAAATAETLNAATRNKPLATPKLTIATS